MQGIPVSRHQDEDFASLFEESIRREEVKEGEIVHGRVIQINKDHVVVDIGYKSEGQVAINEFMGPDGQLTIKEGDPVDVYLESRENENGLCVLSKEKADRLKVWDEISAACERDELIEGVISQRVKGGLAVGIKGGVKAFLPGSQVDLRPVRNLDSFIGKSFKFKVIKFNKKRGNIVLSRRVLLEKERAELKEQTLEKLTEGQTVEGIVKNLTEYGAFIDLGGIEGMLHVSELSFQRARHPKDVLTLGQEIEVQIIRLEQTDDKRKPEKISLSLKSLEKDPWSDIETRFPEGTRTTGTVSRTETFGAIVEIEPGVEGLLHISELGKGQKLNHANQVVKPGDRVDVVVQMIDREKRRMSLGSTGAGGAGGRDPETPSPAAVNAPARFGTFGDLFKNAKKK